MRRNTRHEEGCTSQVDGPAAARLLAEVGETPMRAGLAGESVALADLFERIVRVARGRVPVHVVGEIGTGKENVARAIHLNSERAGGAFIAESCANLREPFLLSRLFGHERGAYTGANSSAAGLFEQANAGTLYLDEVRDLTLAAQACLVRVLDTGEYRPLGAGEARRSNFRLVTSSSFELRPLVTSGLLRADLYFRIRGAILRVPPLRERREDIVHLIEQFLLEIARRERRAPNLLSPAARNALIAHDWPGNIRELRHELTQALLCADGAEITAEALSFVTDPPPRPQPLNGRGAEATIRGLKRDLGEFEEITIRDALRAAGGNKAEAARRLGITRRTLYRRLRRLDRLGSSVGRDLAPDPRVGEADPEG
jgi:DNA-binding NtrC family response regulator